MPISTPWSRFMGRPSSADHPYRNDGLGCLSVDDLEFLDSMLAEACEVVS